MLIPEQQPPRLPGRSPWIRVVTAAAAASVVALLVSVALLALNASAPLPAYVLGAEATAVASALAGVVAIGTGVGYAYATRPGERATIMLVLLVTAAILGAHLYIVNSPATSTPRSVSGQVNTVFQDNRITVSSTLNGDALNLNVTNISGDNVPSDPGYQTGGSTVTNLAVSLGNVTLPESGFANPPTFNSPLQPAYASAWGYPSGVSGSWSVAHVNASRLTVSYQELTCYHVAVKTDTRGVYGCVMDETYYVPWVSETTASSYGTPSGFLAGTQCSSSTQGCNLEHPPLAKALIAAGVAVFGLNDFGWRISDAILGTACIPLLFLLVYMVSHNRRLSIFSSILLGLDTMFFVHSSAALIDIAPVFFTLVGLVFYFWKARLWRIDTPYIAGVFLGLAILSKETAVLSLAALLSYELIFGGRKLRASAYEVLKIGVPAFLVFSAGLQVYDSLFVMSSQGTYGSVSCIDGCKPFYEQVRYILSYGSSLIADQLKCSPVTGYWCKYPNSPGGPPILPTDWLLYYTPVGYLITRVSVTVSSSTGTSSYSFVGVGYYGIADVIVVWLVFAWVPLLAYVAVRNYRMKLASSPDERMTKFALVWFLWSYVPYLFLFLFGRVTYPFYIIPALPPLAIGASYFVTRPWFPRKMAIIYILAAFVLFFLYFPLKDFLPDWLRVLLAR